MRGEAPSGRLVVTGSACFGGVPACGCTERTISICNVGPCPLDVSSVKLKRKNRHWKLVNNPFPAVLQPGSCLGLVIRYHATEKCPRSQELIITSNDPATPVKVLDLCAYTVWECGCKDCDDYSKGHCQKCCHRKAEHTCCWDDDGDDHRKEEDSGESD